MKYLKRINESTKIDNHRKGLIDLYENQLKDIELDFISTNEEQPFMTLVLKEAIRKLTSKVDPTKVENWVVNLEKSWRTI
jgi:hypothetical protein